MKLQIENWIIENKYSENVNILFKDSIICYKAGAYRASLLFSYLGFMTILKERIVSSNKPNNFPQGEWDKIVSKLQNEDTWEVTVFDATQQQEKIDQATKARIKDPIFNVNESLRMQIKYWKDRRNDCAHFKDNIIDTYHVESFWAFLESNLPKITIEGGVQSLLNKIKKHFNPTFTPPNKDITPLILEIEHSVEISKMKEFWESILNSSWNYNMSNNLQKFVNRSFEIGNDNVNQSLIEVLKENRYLLQDFFSNYPDKIIQFNYTPEEIRKFWMTILPQFYNPLPVYATLLRNCLIPREEVDEANEKIINYLREYKVESHDHQIFVANNLFDVFKVSILLSPNFEQFLWVNDRADLISDMIILNPADIDVINRLCLVYNQATNSNWLLERFDRNLLPNTQLRNDYKNIIQVNNIQLPNKLKKYF